MSPELWALFQEGNERAFRAVVETYSPRLLGLIHGWTKERDDVEDLLQEAWIRIYVHRAGCTERGAFLGWAMVICRNLVMDRFRSESARRERQTEFSHASSDASRQSFQPPDTEDAARGLPPGLLKEILALPDLQRDVVILRLLEGCSTQETADRLGRASGTVKASLHRALNTLRERLQEWRT